VGGVEGNLERSGEKKSWREWEGSKMVFVGVSGGKQWR